MDTKPGGGWDLARRAGALTLEPLELEKSCSPQAHLPQTSGTTFISGELTPLTLAPGSHSGEWSHSASMSFPGTKDIYFSSKQTFFFFFLAQEYPSEFQKIQVNKNKTFIIFYNYFLRNLSTTLLTHILHKCYLLVMSYVTKLPFN